MYIENWREFIQSVREGKCTRLGGYPKFWLCEDGCVLSYEAARDNALQIARSIRDEWRNRDWRVVAVDVNWEDNNLRCAHYDITIEAAYPKASLCHKKGI